MLHWDMWCEKPFDLQATTSYVLLTAPSKIVDLTCW